ncbi:MAG: PQQ-binding-like beta-propeller repeat protein [Planctomycetota bacterium]
MVNAEDKEKVPAPLGPLPDLELDFASPNCAILCPPRDDLQTAAQKLADAIVACAGHKPRVVEDTTDPAALGRGPLLVLGNLAVGAASRKLYLTGYDFTDYAWPGKGGRVVRTIRDPFGTGAHVLFIGGSYPEDIASATARAGEIIAKQGPRLRYVNDVKLGANADVIQGWTSEFLKNDVAWKREGSWGSWEYLLQIGKAGMGYLRTGDEAYLPIFKRELLYFFEHDVLHRKQETPSQIHSVIDAVLLPWDLFADHPFFKPEDRRDVDEKFLFLARTDEGPRPLRDQGWKLRGNHGLGRALDGFWLARYFQRRYGIEDAKEWFDMVDKFFAPQLTSSKPSEDGGYHQYGASLLCTLMYALAASKEDYLKSRALKEATDRTILDHWHGRGLMAYLGARAVSANDPGYLALMAHAGKDAYLKHCAGMGDSSVLGENFRSFCGFEAPEEKKELLGANIAPLDPMWHAQMKEGSGGTELRVTTSPEQSFDKLVLRDGYKPESFYLKIDGLGGGGHSFQDANCIIEYRDRGALWLREEYGYSGPTCSTIRQQNGLLVALNGQGPGGAHACARLLYVTKLSNGCDAAGCALDGLGDVAWQRHILRKQGAWTLVLDRAMAKKPGELFTERHWHIDGDVTAREDGVLSRQGSAAFHLQSAGPTKGGMSGTKNRVEIIRANIPADGCADMASLIYVDDKPSETRYGLAQTPKGWRVSDAKDGSTVYAAIQKDRLVASSDGVASDTAAPLTMLPAKPVVASACLQAVRLPWRKAMVGDEITAVAVGPDCIAAGTKRGSVVVMGLDGAERRRAKVGTLVLSLHFLKDDLLVGEEDGTITRFDATGKRLWGLTIPYVRMGWPHWSDQKSRIREITSADLNGNGEQDIILSNGDRRLYALTGSGKEIWKRAGGWGVCIALTPTIYQGKPFLFAGITGPTLAGQVVIIDAKGESVQGLQVTRMPSQQIRDIRLCDLTGDGKREIIVARDTPSNQIVACNEERNPIWQADVAGSPDAIAVRAVQGEAQLLCASRCGYLHAFAGATGKQLWFSYFGDEARILWPRKDDSIVAVCSSGNVFLVSGEGKLLGCETLGSPVTALLRPGEDRINPSVLPVGTADGTVRILGAM